MNKETERMFLKHYQEVEAKFEEAQRRKRYARCAELESYLEGFSQAVLFAGSKVIQDYVLSKPNEEGE